MSNHFKWLHLSDFHVGKDDYAQRRLFDKILRHVDDEKATGQVPHAIFITGDVANSGDKREYDTFREEFYGPLRSALPDARVFAVPGNHDVRRPQPDALNRAALLEPGNVFFDPDAKGKRAREQVTPRFKAYKQKMALDVSPDWVAQDKGTFVERVEIAGRKIGVVGINTAWLAMGKGDEGALTPGYNLVETALEGLRDVDLRIVLGHHPLDWIEKGEAERLRALFGQHAIVYLHGHLHQADGVREQGAGSDFLVFQAGAAFQARDGERWRNGLLWGEADFESRELRLCPRFWNPKNLDWPAETGRFPERFKVAGRDAWAWRLPDVRRSSVSGIASAGAWRPPKGWQCFDLRAMEAKRAPISEADATRFFDGAEPDWALAMCEDIPRRGIVSTLAEELVVRSGRDRPQVHLLIGPGGEGKSMALRQIAVQALERADSMAILWHHDPLAPLSPKDIHALPTHYRHWLVVSDAADLIAEQLHACALAVANAERTEVQFLLAVRDVDWRIAEADRIPWRQSRVDLHRHAMSGVDEADADAIVGAWLRFEAEGNSTIGSTPREELAGMLLSTSKDGHYDGDGALLGGALTLRRGDGLREHVRTLLERLDAVSIPGGETLGTAFRCMAAMHAEGLYFLTRPVLAELLGCKPQEVQTSVVSRLGKEAGGGGGTILLTRHRRIAEILLSIVSEELMEDVDDLYVRMARAAKVARLGGTYVPELGFWDYELAEHFRRSKPELAHRIARSMLHEDARNTKLLVNLARLYRVCGQAAEGAKLLEGHPVATTYDRGFWTEWAACAGVSQNYELNIVLGVQVFGTDMNVRSLAADDLKYCLGGLVAAFGKLYQTTRDPVYNLARGAATQFALSMGFDEMELNEQFRPAWQAAVAAGARIVEPSEALQLLSDGMSRAWNNCMDRKRLQHRLTVPEALDLDVLLTLTAGRAPAIPPLPRC